MFLFRNKTRHTGLDRETKVTKFYRCITVLIDRLSIDLPMNNDEQRMSWTFITLIYNVDAIISSNKYF